MTLTQASRNLVEAQDEVKFARQELVTARWIGGQFKIGQAKYNLSRAKNAAAVAEAQYRIVKGAK